MTRMILNLSVCAILLFSPIAASRAYADDKADASKGDPKKLLIGTWQLETAKNPGSPSGIGTRLKLFTGTHWCIIQPDPASGEIVFQHGGHYSFDGNVLSETIDFAGESTSSLIGKTFKLKIKVDKDSLKQMDPDGVFNETWKRAKKKNGE